MRKIIALFLVIMLVSVLLVGCGPAEPEGALPDKPDQQQEPEEVSEFEPDLIAEDEVDIGEMV